MVDQLRRDVEQLGQQAEARARLSREEFQSLNMVLQEVLQTLTRLALTSRGSEPMQVPVPVPVFPEGHTPGLGQGPGCSPGPGKVRHPVRVPRASIPATTIAAGVLVIIPTVARTRGGDPRAIPLEPR